MISAFEQAVGKTALHRLKWASERAGANIYGKAEYANPGGSIKDRAALWMIRDAEARGVLVRGEPGIVVEGTAGNTGIGLALAASTLGYLTVICLAETQSDEKKGLLRWAGAHLVQVPAVPFKNPNNYVHVAARVSQQLSSKVRTLYANQWDNPANYRSHVEGTGPELYAALGSRLNGFCCAVGTGGTLRGMGDFLRSKLGAQVTIALSDPKGACIKSYYETGVLKAEGSSISEGIGQSRVTGNLQGFRPDICMEISDEEMMEALAGTQAQDGLMLGGSSGINVAGAIRLGRKLGPGSTVATVLCDLGNRYAAKLYAPAFLHSKGLSVPDWLESHAMASKFRPFDLDEAVRAAIANNNNNNNS